MTPLSFLLVSLVQYLHLYLPLVNGQSIPGATFFYGGGTPGSAAYQLVDNYEPATFFDKFNYYAVSSGSGFAIGFGH